MFTVVGGCLYKLSGSMHISFILSPSFVSDCIMTYSSALFFSLVLLYFPYLWWEKCPHQVNYRYEGLTLYLQSFRFKDYTYYGSLPMTIPHEHRLNEHVTQYIILNTRSTPHVHHSWCTSERYVVTPQLNAGSKDHSMYIFTFCAVKKYGDICCTVFKHNGQ